MVGKRRDAVCTHQVRVRSHSVEKAAWQKHRRLGIGGALGLWVEHHRSGFLLHRPRLGMLELFIMSQFRIALSGPVANTPRLHRCHVVLAYQDLIESFDLEQAVDSLIAEGGCAVLHIAHILGRL